MSELGKPENGWNEWSRRILYQLDQLEKIHGEHTKRLEEITSEIKSQIAEIEKQLVLLQYKSSLLGGLSGIAAYLLIYALSFLQKAT